MGEAIKIKRKTPAYKKHIDLMCKGCIYDPHEKGKWREQVAACTSGNCPLYPVRPLPKGDSHGR